AQPFGCRQRFHHLLLLLLLSHKHLPLAVYKYSIPTTSPIQPVPDERWKILLPSALTLLKCHW
ncbi:hypothetical protein ACEP38_33605, partial [Pseudomonas aeruginosa]